MVINKTTVFEILKVIALVTMAYLVMLISVEKNETKWRNTLIAYGYGEYILVKDKEPVFEIKPIEKLIVPTIINKK